MPSGKDSDKKYWEWLDDPSWPHYATQFDMTALSRGEDEDVEYWEWLEDHWWYHYAIQDGVKAPSSIRGYLQEEKEELNWVRTELPA